MENLRLAIETTGNRTEYSDLDRQQNGVAQQPPDRTPMN
jgi:hypothetical protein